MGWVVNVLANRISRISPSRQRDEIIAIMDYLKAHTARKSVTIEELGLENQHMNAFRRFLNQGLVEETNGQYYLVQRRPTFQRVRRRERTFTSLFEGFGDKDTQMIMRPIIIMVAVITFIAVVFMLFV